MTKLLRDNVFGHCSRFSTSTGCFQYVEEKDPSLWKQYMHVEKTGHMAGHGQLGGEMPTSNHPKPEDSSGFFAGYFTVALGVRAHGQHNQAQD